MPTDETNFHHPRAPRSEPRREPPEFGGATGVEPSRAGGTDRSTAPARSRQFETETTGGYPGLRNARSRP